MTWRSLFNQLTTGPSAFKVVGMPAAHARAFMQVASSQKCVISSRELGRVGTGLVEEGYDSKGFRIKAKTCNFGPMAGFVCTNRNYSKRGVADAKKQEGYVKEALKDTDKVGWNAATEHICISQARLDWLRENLGLPAAAFSQDDSVLYGRITEPLQVAYVLRRQPHAVTHDLVWHLYAVGDDTELQRILGTPALKRQAWDLLKTSLKLAPIEAMVNPYAAYPRGNYRNCCCGDYDLFAVWPRRQDYEPTGEDRRIAGMFPGDKPANADARNYQIRKWEDKRLGNISNRVHMVAQMINSLLPAAPGAIAGRRDMVHHSDEAGRPMVTEVEVPVIAFIPGCPEPGWIGTAVAAETVQQVGIMMQLCDVLGFQVILNAGWKTQLAAHIGQLGDTGDAKGWQTPHELFGRPHPSRAQ